MRKSLTTIVRTNNKSSYDNINSTTPADEKRTRVDIPAIRQSERRKEISLEWIRKENQLADVLTKRGRFKKVVVCFEKWSYIIYIGKFVHMILCCKNENGKKVPTETKRNKNVKKKKK